MGNLWSSRRRNNYFPPPPPPHLPPPYYYSAESHLPAPPPLPPQPQGYYLTNSYVNTPPLPPPPPPPSHPHTHSFSYSNGHNYCPNYGNSVTGRFQYQPYYVNQGTGGWPPIRPPLAPANPPPPYVDHQTAKKVKNDVNVHKDTLRLELDEHNPDQHLVSFVFDALYDGSISIIYFAKEVETCKFSPTIPEIEPVRIPFQKGAGQKFCQPSGTGIDLGFFELDVLSKPSQEDVFPLVVCAETYSRTPPADENLGDFMADISPNKQITQAVIEKSNGSDCFQVKVIRQILWIDGARYELREIYGIGSSSAADFNDNDPEKEECVICMTEPKDTAVLPCRHMCMCSECAKALRLQSNKCPICRQSIEELIEIKINNGN
ncbi:probable E3 ubiquitin-protein ligase LUL4 [Prosopis cineraria]|uniref:probable E3 ubiquitin-protein ligase LUL4 n=1 Tax=Prosopis cineraria TaxID=364024 RepID=UPI002410972F|nr:probable E3 ubiquitin-protein ligase LUL4 [Prosopis cineraria]